MVGFSAGKAPSTRLASQALHPYVYAFGAPVSSEKPHSRKKSLGAWPPLQAVVVPERCLYPLIV